MALVNAGQPSRWLGGISSLALIGTALALLAGCGGGGGGDEAASAPAPIAAPSGLSYPAPQTYAVGTTITPLQPTVTGTVSTYSVSPQLPAGLVLNFSTGTITGTPGATSPETAYTVMAANGSGSVSFDLRITVTTSSLTYTIGGTASGLPTGATVELTNNGVEGLEIVANGSFSFPTQLYGGSEYSVVVSRQPETLLCAIANGSGTVVSNNITNLQITCAPPSWKIPTVLDTSFGAPHTSLAMRQDGSAILVWLDDGSAFRARFFHPASGWSATETVGPVDAAPGFAAVAYDQNGHATVVWRTRFQEYLTWYRYSPTLGWSGAGELPAGSGGSSTIGSNVTEPKIAVDGSGRILALWRRFQSGTGALDEIYALHASIFDPDTGWGAAQSLSDPSASVLEFDLAVGSDGSAMVIWTRYLPAVNESQVYARTLSAGGAWGTPTRLESQDTPAYSPRVAVDPTGNAVATWAQATGSVANGRDTYVRRYDSALGWEAEQIVSDPSMLDTSNISVAIGSDGTALVAWSQADSLGHDVVQASRYTESTGWSTPAFLHALPSLGRGFNPSASIDGRGNGFVVWEQYDDSAVSGASYVHANRYVPGTGWGTAEQISQDVSAIVYVPKVLTDTAGRAIAAWYHHPHGTSTQSALVNTFE